MRRSSITCTLLVSLFALLASGCATLRGAPEAVLAAMNPEPGPPPISTAAAGVLTDAEVTRRLGFVTERLDAGRRHASLWQYGWLLVNAGGMTAATVQAAGASGDDRVFAIIGASKGALGTAYVLAQPMPGRSGADPIRALPGETLEDRAAQLVAAEALLYEAAARSAQRTAWPMHLGNIALNLVGGVVLLARDNAGLAALSFGVDAAVGEVQILSQPWQPRTHWQEYQRTLAGNADGVVPPQHRGAWRLAPAPGGLALAFDF